MLTQLFKDRNFVLISLVSFVVFFTRNGTLVQILPLLVSDRLGASAGGIGVSLTILSTFNFIALLLCGKLSDRFGRKALIIPGVILTAVAIVMLSLTQSYWFLLLTCIIWGIGSGSAAPVPAAYVVDILPRENYSGGMSLYRTVCDLGFVIGPVLIGWLADIKGFNFPLLFNASFLLLAVLLFQVIAKEPSRYKEPEAAGSK